MIPAIIILNILGIVSGFLLGKLHERVQWNDLIQKGIIRKPSKEKL